MPVTHSEPRETKPEKAKNFTMRIGCFIIGVVGLVLLYSAMPPFGGITERGKQIHDISNAKNLVTGCQLYADDWDGKFPDKLRDLYPDYIDDERLFRTTAYKKREFKDYIYFTGRTIEKDGENMLLIASPVVRKGKRVVGFTGGNCRVIDEGIYQLILKSETILRAKNKKP